jgi:hypothetical protein
VHCGGFLSARCNQTDRDKDKEREKELRTKRHIIKWTDKIGAIGHVCMNFLKVEGHVFANNRILNLISMPVLYFLPAVPLFLV